MKAVIAVGSLTCSPKHVLLPPSFPVRELGRIKCLLAVFFLHMPFSWETTALNSMSNCWRGCASELLWSVCHYFGGCLRFFHHVFQAWVAPTSPQQPAWMGSWNTHAMGWVSSEEDRSVSRTSVNICCKCHVFYLPSDLLCHKLFWSFLLLLRSNSHACSYKDY